VEFAQGRIEALNKKAATKKPTKTQVENEALKGKIADVLDSDGQTVTEILSKLAVEGLSNQKVSAILRQMVESGEVVKTTDKKKSLFSLAA
jgi:Glu-tRNA(Gln) amidotransferase subunit E-like FAD-binding protein